MCEEVQVKVEVQRVLRTVGSNPPTVLTYRFGGGLFNVDNLRKDLLSGPRYFFLAAPSSDKAPIFRTSYPWLLGATVNVENDAEVRQVLEQCPPV
ncbi:hypothetical protein [Xanthomonas sp. 10-10]|uniref:Uncharacterized protein n=2 Tax=unclassified Xanthomonas TaxID=2643310 RepID=A0AAU7PA41_9XANT